MKRNPLEFRVNQQKEELFQINLKEQQEKDQKYRGELADKLTDIRNSNPENVEIAKAKA